MVSMRGVSMSFVLFASNHFATVQAGGFLVQKGLSLEEADQTLDSELSGQISPERLNKFVEVLRPTYTALPKNENGYLEHQTVRYVLHRMFANQFGWFIKGLEPDGDVWQSTTTQEKLKDWVPSYLLGRLEERLENHGLTLEDLAKLAAALEDLVRKEARQRLGVIYTSLELVPGEVASSAQVQDALADYLIYFVTNNNVSTLPQNAGQAAKYRRKFASAYPGWKEAKAWLGTVQDKYPAMKESEIAYGSVVDVAVDVDANFYGLNDQECRDLKQVLLSKSQKSGRVSLSDFYKLGLNSHWNLNEKIEYLRSLGALDETDPESPQVIVPNYLTARPNCLEATTLFDVCCRDECEDLMGSLERAIEAPTAKPERIAELVSAQQTDTVPAGRKLSPELLKRLDSVAELHGGEVNLHGRLFAQWMHHAFPNECPFPHEGGTTQPVTPDEWMASETSASQEEMQRFIKNGTALVGELPWHHHEELLSDSHVSMKDAEKSLQQEFSPSEEQRARIAEFKDALRDTYLALPKNSAGHLEHQTVRYVLHRLFVQRHGWFIKGLEPNGDMWHTQASQATLKEWVPSFLLTRVEERVGERGLDLDDLAALAAAFEDLVNVEANGRMQDIYDMLGFKKDGLIKRDDAQLARNVFMVKFLEAGNYSLPTTPERVERVTRYALRMYQGWADVENWIKGIEAGRISHGGGVDLATSSAIAQEIGAKYHKYNDLECSDLKKVLIGMRSKKEGRVPLPEFYKKGLATRWNFNEKPEFLRAMGALDETYPQAAKLIIPNYVQSRSNCLEATNLYAVCCRNECEDLMGVLERELGAPEGATSRILELVRGMRSDTVAAGREISAQMVDRLKEIAAHHGGKVNIHGRLFAQWMHHAYPNECPFPHAAGASSPATPDEWISGGETKMSKEEVTLFANMEHDEEQHDSELPWSNSEELLGSKHKDITLQQVESTLKSELAASVRSGALEEYRAALAPTFAALPKNSQGLLEHQAVRYVLHRLFVKRHGWFIKGLEPDGDTWHTQASSSTLKDWVPSYLVHKLEELIGGKGVDLNDLAALAAALEDLLRQEAHNRMQDVYRTLEYPQTGTISRHQAQDAVTDYFIGILMNNNSSSLPVNEASARDLRRRFIRAYDGWDAAEEWVRGVEKEFMPAKSTQIDFSVLTSIASDINNRFGEFNDRECKDMKSTMMKVQGKRAGRVHLADFYKMGLYSHWNFTEKVEYLRALGAMDETTPQSPMVIMPNYIGARPNCLEATDLISVCCRNECEDLMGSLEESIASPEATPEKIVQFVSSLASDTVTAPRELAKDLVSRLDEIAVRHGGKVNLHGRLFAQWMHHAYPNECPFPHEAGTSAPVTPDEWLGKDVKSSEEEIKKFVAESGCKMGEPCKDHSADESLPWSHTEELLGSQQLTATQAEQSLEKELDGRVDRARLASIKMLLRATYNAMPKNEQGNLNHNVARYLLHRHFVSERGWYIKGLEPDGDTYQTKASAGSMKEWVPAFLLGKMEERVGNNRGLDLHDLAALVAALEDLAEKEAGERMQYLYQVLGLKGDVSGFEADEAIITFVMDYLSARNFTFTQSTAMANRHFFSTQYAGWFGVENWLHKKEGVHFDLSSKSVPFASVVSLAAEVGSSFRSINDQDCSALKGVLTKIQAKAAGRVRLSDFYRRGLQSNHWEFNEKVDYLRALGALDESNASMPMVIIPNYVSSRPNCLEATNLYAVCCRNECEDIMGQLELKIASPMASPQQIKELVSQISSDTVSAPRQLSAEMLERLSSMSNHQGQVNLHSRLFAQWMHHAYPNECPFPHAAGTTSPLTPDEWIGVGVSASIEERQKIVDEDACSAQAPESDEALPWTDSEELLAKPGGRKASARADMLRMLVGAVLSASLAFFSSSSKSENVRRRFLLRAAQRGYTWQMLFGGACCVIACVLDLINPTMFGLMMIVGVVPSLLNRSTKDHQVNKLGKQEKCLV